MYKVSQQLGNAPPDPCSGNSILFWKPLSKNPGFAPHKENWFGSKPTGKQLAIINAEIKSKQLKNYQKQPAVMHQVNLVSRHYKLHIMCSTEF